MALCAAITKALEVESDIYKFALELLLNNKVTYFVCIACCIFHCFCVG
jgi:hypothetical protein